jgi:hypothetical protein
MKLWKIGAKIGWAFPVAWSIIFKNVALFVWAVEDGKWWAAHWHQFSVTPAGLLTVVLVIVAIVNEIMG